MNIEELRNYCLSKKAVSESFPFDETTLVFKVYGKMFALAGIEPFLFINLKCLPEKALELREEYHAIKPGYHMNKVHWNSVYVNSDANDELICSLIDESYNLVADSVSQKKKNEYHD